MIKLALKNETNATVYKTDLIQEIGVERSEAERERERKPSNSKWINVAHTDDTAVCFVSAHLSNISKFRTYLTIFECHASWLRWRWRCACACACMSATLGTRPIIVCIFKNRKRRVIRSPARPLERYSEWDTIDSMRSQMFVCLLKIYLAQTHAHARRARERA